MPNVCLFAILLKGVFFFFKFEGQYNVCLTDYGTNYWSISSQHELSLESLDLSQSTSQSIINKMKKLYSALTFCLEELGVWLALKVLSNFPGSVLVVTEMSDRLMDLHLRNRLLGSFPRKKMNCFHGGNWMCWARIL